MRKQMSKLVIPFAVALLVFGMAGASFASFGDLELIRTIYDPSTTNTTEIGSDLGTYAKTTSGAYGSNQYVGTNVATSSFADAVSTLKISYFAKSGSISGSTKTDNYWITDFNPTQAMKGKASSTIFGAVGNVQTYYNTTSAGAVTANGTTGATGSYWLQLDNNGNNLGTMRNTVSAQAAAADKSIDATVSLAALATKGYVDTNLFYYNYNNSQTSMPGTLVATIRTFLTSDGKTVSLTGNQIATVINYSQVPVPPSLLLFGSSLLGLIGVRRFHRG